MNRINSRNGITIGFEIEQNPEDSTMWGVWERPRPDVDIAIIFDSEIEQFVALQEPNEIWAAWIASNPNEEVCFYLAICELLDKEFLAEFPPKDKYQEQLMLSVVMCQAGIHAGAFERAAFNHDVDDVCLAITNGGLVS